MRKASLQVGGGGGQWWQQEVSYTQKDWPNGASVLKLVGVRFLTLRQGHVEKERTRTNPQRHSRTEGIAVNSGNLMYTEKETKTERDKEKKYGCKGVCV